MDKVFKGMHTCSVCNNEFYWEGYYFDKTDTQSRYINNVRYIKVKDINYINGKYIVQLLNCEKCCHSDEITIEDK